MLGKLMRWIFEPLSNVSIPAKSETITNPPFQFQEKITAKDEENTYKVSIPCQSCHQVFKHEVNLENARNAKLNEEINFQAICPNCGQSFSGTIQRQTPRYSCKYCFQGFESKEEAEVHEKSCPMSKE